MELAIQSWVSEVTKRELDTQNKEGEEDE